MNAVPAVDALRFLIVEDHGFQRWMLENALRGLGATRILAAGDGRSALEAMAGDPVDIVVSDLDMPGMDGMEFIRHLGEVGYEVSLIVSSSLERALVSSVETMARAYGVRLLGAVDKPVTPARLAEVIARHGGTPAAPGASPGPFTREEVEDGLRRGQFEAWFQPKVRMRDGRAVGAEALARWRHPSKGLVAPQHFVALLERDGRIGALTDLMLRRAVAACRAWRAAGVSAHAAVNLSLSTVADMTIADRLQQLVVQHGLEPRHVMLEITESAEAADLGRAIENLARLRMRGFGLSIDDFGTGYSSLQQLARIPFTELKIDRSFVRMAATGEAKPALLESSLELAARLGMTAVAEGVETQAEWDLLDRLGCPAAQGFLVAAPMPGEAILDWMSKRG